MILQQKIFLFGGAAKSKFSKLILFEVTRILLRLTFKSCNEKEIISVPTLSLAVGSVRCSDGTLDKISGTIVQIEKG